MKAAPEECPVTNMVVTDLTTNGEKGQSDPYRRGGDTIEIYIDFLCSYGGNGDTYNIFYKTF